MTAWTPLRCLLFLMKEKNSQRLAENIENRSKCTMALPQNLLLACGEPAAQAFLQMLS